MPASAKKVLEVLLFLVALAASTGVLVAAGLNERAAAPAHVTR